MGGDRPCGREQSRERGFTLVELMVVVSILAVLVGIGVPTFMRAYWQSENTAARTHLRAATKAAWVQSVETDAFADDAAALAGLADIEPSFTYVDGATASTEDTMISVAEDAGGIELAMAARSESGTCYYVRLSRVTQESLHTDEPAECRADAYVDGPNSGW